MPTFKVSFCSPFQAVDDWIRSLQSLSKQIVRGMKLNLLIFQSAVKLLLRRTDKRLEIQRKKKEPSFERLMHQHLSGRHVEQSDVFEMMNEEIWIDVSKCMMANTSILWQKNEHTTNCYLLAAQQEPYKKKKSLSHKEKY